MPGFCCNEKAARIHEGKQDMIVDDCAIVVSRVNLQPRLRHKNSKCMLGDRP